MPSSRQARFNHDEKSNLIDSVAHRPHFARHEGNSAIAESSGHADGIEVLISEIVRYEMARIHMTEGACAGEIERADACCGLLLVVKLGD